jgi:dihydrofolate synthase/folylpolyglutamate synthase
MAKVIRGIGAETQLVPELPGMQRRRPASEVAEALGNGAVAVENVAAAVNGLPNEGISLICGSLYLLAEFFSLRPDSLRPQQ